VSAAFPHAVLFHTSESSPDTTGFDAGGCTAAASFLDHVVVEHAGRWLTDDDGTVGTPGCAFGRFLYSINRPGTDGLQACEALVGRASQDCRV
jgi:hypothetical protein